MKTKTRMLFVLVICLASCAPAWREYNESNGRLISSKYPFSLAKLPNGWLEQKPADEGVTMHFRNGDAQITVAVLSDMTIDDCLPLLSFLTTDDDELVYTLIESEEKLFGSVPGCTGITSIRTVSPPKDDTFNYFTMYSILIDNNNGYWFTYQYRNRQGEEPIKWMSHLPTFEDFVNSYRSEP